MSKLTKRFVAISVQELFEHNSNLIHVANVAVHSSLTGISKVNGADHSLISIEEQIDLHKMCKRSGVGICNCALWIVAPRLFNLEVQRTKWN
jgi:hypothetical protein